MAFVLDASIILANLNKEHGGGRLEEFLGDAAISVVTYAEIVTKLLDNGMPFESAIASASLPLNRLARRR